MKTQKRFLSLALALGLTLSLAPMALAAEETPERGVIHYEEVIAPQYEDAHSFSEDLAAVKKGGKWGYIDTDNKVVIPFQYDQAYDFSEGLAIVGKLTETEDTTEWQWNEETGEEYEAPVTYYTVEYGLIDKAGKYTAFMDEEYNWEADSYTPTALNVTFTSMEFENADHIFHNGYVWMGEYGGRLYDTAGKQVKDAEGEALWADKPTPVNEGLVLTGDFWDGFKYVDVKTGKTVIDTKNIPGAVVDEYGYPPYGIEPACAFNQGLAPIYTLYFNEEDYNWYYDKMGFIDRQGSWVIQPAFGTGYYYQGINTTQRLFGDTGLAMVKGTNEKYGAIDKQGKTVIPFQYDELWSDNEGRIAFCQNGKYGYLDAAGDHSVVIPAQFEKASGYSNGLAAVYDGTRAYLIDWSGKAVPGTEDLDPDAYFKEDEDGNKSTYAPGEYLTIQKNGKYGFGHVEYLPALPEKDEMNSWAYTEVTAAIEADLVPASMQNLYDANITRGEFCSLAVQAIEAVTGKDVEDVVKETAGKDLSAFQREYPFLDSSSSDVIACYALGIVQGRGNGVADPYASITRQEAAAYLARTAKVMGMDVDAGDELPFADASSVGEWFIQAVAFVVKKGVMNGTGNDQFTPLGNYTREQSYITFYRLYNAAQ